MMQRKWLAFSDEQDEDLQPRVEVSKSMRQMVKRDRRDAGQRTTLTVRYSVGGAWEGSVGEFQLVEIPETSLMEKEGYPALPKTGIFVAVPMDATEVEVRLAGKSTLDLDHTLAIAPAPRQFTEEEFREVREPAPEVYASDEAYPGKDFDFLGLKTVGGIRVAHVMVYLAQYRPQSGRVEMAASMVLEVSYRTPPGTDRQPGRMPREIPESDLILGLDQLDPQTDFLPGGDRASLDAGEAEVLDDEDEEGAANWRGVSMLELVEDELLDPTLASPGIVGGVVVRPPTGPVLPTLAKLRISGLIAEYVIVTPRVLERSVAPLLAAKSGWPYYAKVALTEDIQAEFPAGGLKESIKAFIVWATANWCVPPRFVVLAADTDLIPMHGYTSGSNTYASDHYYADIEGQSLVPEIAVSRIPTSNPKEMQSVCEHLVRYAALRGGDWGGWQNRVMLCAYQSSTYETTCDEIDSRISKRYTVVKRYAKNTSRSDVVDTMNQGVVIAMYRGHGSKTEWSSSNGLRVSDVPGLSNAGFPPFVLDICCQNGWVDDNGVKTITESLVRDRKSVAVFASSRNSWTYPNNDFAKYIFDAVMSGKCQTPASIVRYAKTKMVLQHAGSSAHSDNTVMYNLFGDPTADVASNAEWLRGDWAMDHDGWAGTLKITRIWDYRVDTAGSFGAPVWRISGSYVSSDGKSYPFSGELGGFDSNQLGAGSKRSDHKIEFHIEFSASNKQRFVGYVHTWTSNRISGLTWWSSHPFGWTAQRE